MLCLPGYIFPALIVALVPFRAYVLSWIFDKDDLAHLDPEEALAPPGKDKHDVDEEHDINHVAEVSAVEDVQVPLGVGGKKPGLYRRQSSIASDVDDAVLPHGFCVEFPGHNAHHVRKASDISELEDVLPHGFCTEYPGRSPHHHRRPSEVSALEDGVQPHVFGAEFPGHFHGQHTVPLRKSS